MAQKPTDADWILKAMVAVAGADGRLDGREVGLIQKVYRDPDRPFSGEHPSHRFISTRSL